MREENPHVENLVKDTTTHGTPFMKTVLEEVAEAINVDVVDEEAMMMVERIIVLRISTKHINLWMRQLEMKRREIGELAGLIGFDGVKTEVEKEKNLEAWGKRCTHYFTRRPRDCCLKKQTTWSGIVEKVKSPHGATETKSTMKLLMEKSKRFGNVMTLAVK